MKSSAIRIGALAAGVAAAVVGACESNQRADAGGQMQNATLDRATGEAEVVGVAMHADWCGVCKEMGPEIMEARGNVENEPFYFIKADHTNRDNPAAAQTLEQFGLGSLYQQNGGKTGVLYLIDAETGEVIRQTGGRGTTSEEITREIERALREARRS